MLEHPEIAWIERTGYPSWLQEGRCRPNDREEQYDRLLTGRKPRDWPPDSPPEQAQPEGEEWMEDHMEKPQQARLRRVAELVLERLEGMLEGEIESKLDSQELKRIATTLKTIRELQEEEAPREQEQEMPAFTVKLEGELEEYGG